MEAVNIIAYTSDISQIEAVKAVLKALKIRFEITKQSVETKSEGYDSEFMAKIQKSRQDYQDGNFITVEKENFKEFLGIE